MICSNCGVDVAEKHSHCPLCGRPLHDADVPEAEENAEEPGATPGRAEPAAEPPLQTRLRVGLWLIEAFTLVAAVGAMVIFAADFAFSSEVGWSRYPLVSIACFWLLSVSSVLFGNRPVLLSVIVIVIAAAFSYVLDRFTGPPLWFPDVAAPILAALLLLLSCSVALALHRRFRVLQTLSLVSFDVGIILLVVEASLQRYFTGEVVVSWSVLGCACFTAVAIVIFYLHRNLKTRHREIRRYLHL